MEDAVAVALKGGPEGMGRLLANPAFRVPAETGFRGQNLGFDLFELFPDVDQRLSRGIS